jgi:hypothetical protein
LIVLSWYIYYGHRAITDLLHNFLRFFDIDIDNDRSMCWHLQLSRPEMVEQVYSYLAELSLSLELFHPGIARSN